MRYLCISVLQAVGALLLSKKMSLKRKEKKSNFFFNGIGSLNVFIDLGSLNGHSACCVHECDTDTDESEHGKTEECFFFTLSTPGVEPALAKLQTLPVDTKPGTSYHRTREGHRQSDQNWNCFKDNFRETSEGRSGTHNYELFRAHKSILN